MTAPVLRMTTTEARPSDKMPARTDNGWHYDAATFPAGRHTPGSYPGQLADVYAQHTGMFALDLDLYKPEKAAAWAGKATGRYLAGRKPYIVRGDEGSQRYLIAATPEQAAQWWPAASGVPWGDIRSAGLAPSPGAAHPSGDIYQAVPGPDPVQYPDGTIVMTNVVRFDEGLKAALIEDGAHARDDRVLNRGDVDLPGDDGRCTRVAAWLETTARLGEATSASGSTANAAVNYLKRLDSEGHRVGGWLDEVIGVLPYTEEGDFAKMWATAPVSEPPLGEDLSCCGGPDSFGMMPGDRAALLNGHVAATALAVPAGLEGAPAGYLAALAVNGAPRALGRRIVRTLASDITPRRVRWLWDERLALGTLALFGGREGAGKSTLCYTLAADITRGTLKGEHFGTPKPVAIVATEDSWEFTIVPRLMGAGADLTLVHKLSVATGEDLETSLVLPYDMNALRAELADSGAVMLILDPLMSRLDASLDTHKDADVRRALEPVTAIADDTGVVVAGLIHVNKTATTDALTSLMGSRAFAAVARTVLYVMADPGDETGARRLLALAKNNLGRSDLPMMAFTIAAGVVAKDPDGRDITTGVLTWVTDVPQLTLAVLMATAAHGPEKVTAEDKAADWLTGYLRFHGGRAESKEVKDAGDKAGHKERTLQRALRQAEVVVENTTTKPRRTYWVLSDGTTDPSRANSRAGTQDFGATAQGRQLLTQQGGPDLGKQEISSRATVAPNQPVPARELARLGPTVNGHGQPGLPPDKAAVWAQAQAAQAARQASPDTPDERTAQ